MGYLFGLKRKGKTMNNVVAIDVREGKKENEIRIVFFDYLSEKVEINVDVEDIQVLMLENKVQKSFNAFMELLDKIREGEGNKND